MPILVIYKIQANFKDYITHKYSKVADIMKMKESSQYLIKIKMARHSGKEKSTRNKSFRKSQAWRYLSRKNNADNFEGRTVPVGGKGLTSREQPDTISTRTINKDQQDEDIQVHFVGNTIKSSKYTIFTFIPR